MSTLGESLRALSDMRDVYIRQSANTRNGCVPEPESVYAINAWKERARDLRERFEDRVSRQKYARSACADAMPADPGYEGGV